MTPEQKTFFIRTMELNSELVADWTINEDTIQVTLEGASSKDLKSRGADYLDRIEEALSGKDSVRFQRAKFSRAADLLSLRLDFIF